MYVLFTFLLIYHTSDRFFRG